ncbi:DUF1127 domain-containing protein [Pseudovibrio sp. Ad37]|uniref:DUF1127 domain-containing protein n=1 Tax=Pseudovibrio sp. Ad37 TaxID=989422 RepID=UPI0007AE9DE3|nr:hypothetical protein [Pseudovibrio sp. Ad37]KZL20178.1 hypothetical protein PsAD37_03627 [Pseudovibrio sp. Ad37]
MQENTSAGTMHFDTNAIQRAGFEPTVVSPRNSILSEASIRGYWLLPLRWAALSKGRRALLNLDRSQLEDIGVSKDEAMLEGRKPFWDVPQKWCN